MTLLTLNDFLTEYSWLRRSLQANQPTEEEQQSILDAVVKLAPKYFNTYWNPHNIPLDSKFGAVMVYLQDYFPGSGGMWLYQAQLFVKHQNGNYSLFDVNLGLVKEPAYLIKDIVSLAG